MVARDVSSGRPGAAALAVGLVCGAVLAGHMALFRGFVLDDAYITYRYARNLALQGTLAWNPGSDPVEGYTSLLWVLINAAGIRLGFDPVLVSKGVGALSALSIAGLLVWLGRGAHWIWILLLTAGVAFSPAFALLAMQGMETTLTALLILLAAWLGMRRLDEEAPPSVWPLFTAVLLAFLARPDTAIFTAPLLAGVAAGLVAPARRKELWRFLRGGAVAGAVIAAYTLWRLRYFGYLFPNTFYIKTAAPGDIGGPSGPDYTVQFLARVAAPYLILLGLVVARFGDRALLRRLSPVLAGLAAFMIYLAAILPIQGMAWRFAFPVLPPLLLCALHSLAAAPPSMGPWPPVTGAWSPSRTLRTAWVLPLAAFFLLWPVRDVHRILELPDQKSQHDRVEAGKSLAGLQGVMLTSEAGALPYYSGWTAVDFLGLTSEEIAHHGLTGPFLERLDPDLVVTRYDRAKGLQLRGAAGSVLMDYMARRGFTAIAAVAKNEEDRHVYFARRDSPLLDAVARRLRGLAGVRYVDLEALAVDARIPALGAGEEAGPAVIP